MTAGDPSLVARASSAAIVVRGARSHNLRGIDVEIPHGRLTVVTGPSGSGKSSLAFDTLYAEAQRRFVEALGTRQRSRMELLPAPDVDSVTGLMPALAVGQEPLARSPRSTLGTVTELHDHLRVLFARLGTPHCPRCGRAVVRTSPPEIVDALLGMPEGTRFVVLAPVAPEGRTLDAVLASLRHRGFARVAVRGVIHELETLLDPRRAGAPGPQASGDLEVVVDRLVARPGSRARIAESVELALREGRGVLRIQRDAPDASQDERFASDAVCLGCGLVLPEIGPRTFSWSSDEGACPTCRGRGETWSIDPALCVRDGSLSIDAGAIAAWGEPGGARHRAMLKALRETLDVPTSVPFSSLPEATRRLVLDGGVLAPIGPRAPRERPASEPSPEKRKKGKEHDASSRTRRRADAESVADPPGPVEKPGKGGVRSTRGGAHWEGVVPQLERALAELSVRADDDDELFGDIEDELGAFRRSVPCIECGGSRLGPVPRAVRLWGTSIDAMGRMPLSELDAFLAGVSLDGRAALIGVPLLRELRARVGFLLAVGVRYLALDRATSTLSAGEAQRIRMAAALGAGLIGVLYVLDEPTQGLHPVDVTPLLCALVDKARSGATVLVVEHDLDVLRAADHVIELGPGAGRLGGTVVAQGTPGDIARSGSVTARFLALERDASATIAPTGEPSRRAETSAGPAPDAATPRQGTPRTTARVDAPRTTPHGWLTLRGASLHNLTDVTVRFAARALTAIAGPSGSGKTSLATGTLLPLAHWNLGGPRPAVTGELRGAGAITRIVSLDEAPMGRSGRSTPATFSGVMGPIRELYATLPEAKARGWDAARFSWNVKGGRCERCEGEGVLRVRMHLVPDVWVPCPLCDGRRYERETLEVRWRGMSIADVLSASIDDAAALFEAIPSVSHKLTTLRHLGLGYLALGQRATTISGGEAQRLALARELSKKGDPGALYILDEPTRGLHPADVEVLADVLRALADDRHTVVVVTHAPAIVRLASHVIELGPGGGPNGGRVVAEGTPAEIIAAGTPTGHVLARS